MRPETVSEALQTDLVVYSGFSLLSTALQSAVPLSLLPASSAFLVRYLQTRGLYLTPSNTSLYPGSFLHRTRFCCLSPKQCWALRSGKTNAKETTFWASSHQLGL